jgi:hypothetical protein
MLVQDSVAEELNLHSGYEIKSDDEFWKILALSCRMGIAERQIAKAQENAKGEDNE